MSNKAGQLNNRISVFRAEKKMTQQCLALKVGVSRQTISSLEKGKYTPSLVLAFEIAHAFGVDINKVFQYKI
ncbi:helix-turn-helix transcriptional regulator [Proteinivorax tanatarense]|uniref:Helix-turn-helix transcriptional regulator n=1 Tax=Proteinivorax tanatarense TaxID=1260629 RepID=A0AAU7VKL0_9FIRM